MIIKHNNIKKDKNHRAILSKIADKLMREFEFQVDFPPAVLRSLDKITGAAEADKHHRDMRDMLWCSIDNDDSLDLDQLSVGEALPDGRAKIYVSVADVDCLVPKDSVIDIHAQQNTTSVYTPAKIFPLFPEKLSTDLTSLNLGVDRLSIVIEMTLRADGTIEDEQVYEAVVRNQAKLAYDSVATWLEGTSEMPEGIAAVHGLAENILLQFEAAKKLRALRHERGALDFDTIQTRPVFEGNELVGLKTEKRNSSKNIIEEFMVAANGVTARFLEAKGFPSLRRIVKVPKRWQSIVELANNYRYRLPEKPDSRALDAFLIEQMHKDPIRFPDLSLSVIKMLGAGEYGVMLPGGSTEGHFGLAVKDYAHSTAPNRRYPDLITQRLLKAAIRGLPVPYTDQELTGLAQQCTSNEESSKKVERTITKSTSALLLEDRIDEVFEVIVTDANDKGTWVRLVEPPVEGKLSYSRRSHVMGDTFQARLIKTDPIKGFIDFEEIGSDGDKRSNRGSQKPSRRTAKYSSKGRQRFSKAPSKGSSKGSSKKSSRGASKRASKRRSK